MWTGGDAYQRFMGRWSALVASDVLDRLAAPRGAQWLDIGCGPGDVTGAVLARCEPADIVGVDPSEAFVAAARERWADDHRASFVVGSAEALPMEDDSIDVVVSGLALNFVPDPERGMAEMARVLRADGRVAVYVWDYGYDDAFLARFWAAAERAGMHQGGDERGRWDVCTPEGLLQVAGAAGLEGTVDDVVVDTVFRDVDELWAGFMLGVGPSGVLATSLDDHARQLLRGALEAALPVAPDGAVPLTARAYLLTA